MAIEWGRLFRQRGTMGWDTPALPVSGRPGSHPATTPRTSECVSRSNPEARHLFPQRRAADAQQFGGLNDLAVGLFERTLDLPALGCVADVGQREEARSGLRSRSIGKEVARHDPLRRGQRHRPVDAVAQLAHVAGPRVRQGCFLRQGAEAADAGVRACRGILQEAVEQPDDVLRPLPERRDVDRKRSSIRLLAMR